ncbi:MAG TPA: MFS transporter [Streptosporangiaceae bacterium]
MSAVQSAGRASAAAVHGAGSVVHRLSRASGAGQTGLSNLIELTAASMIGDAFVAVALAGTLFFNTSLDQARTQVALYLLITMAPFAVLAPFIGPMLDRMQQGRRYILAGTLVARGLLCWGMSAALHGSPVTLFPAAFGVLILQKAYGVTRSAVTPRLLPPKLTLVSANARLTLASLLASSIGVVVGAGVQWATGATWVLRVGALIYIAGAVLGIRLPGSVDAEERAPGSGQQAGAEAGQEPGATGVPGQQAGTARPGRSKSGRPTRRLPVTGGLGRRLRSVGPVVGEAMRGNAVLRAYSGFMLFFLAFLLRTEHFGGLSHNAALAALAIAVAAGGFIGTATGSRIRSRRPHRILFAMLAAAALVTAACAWFFGLWAALIVAFIAATAQALAKLALDSTVQQETGEEIRSSTFAVSETLNQLSWVSGGLAGLALSLTSSGAAGLTFAAVGLAAGFVLLLAGRRHRTVVATHTAAARPPAPQPR